MERRVLSSAQTFAAMYGGPALFLLGSPVLAAMFHLGLFWRWTHEVLAPLLAAGLEPYFWLAWTGVNLVQLWWGLRLKRVAVDDEQLYISDYFEEVAVPLAAIQEVRENRWIDLHPVTIELFSDTPWGSTIRFMPKIRYFTPDFVSHPVVAELRELAFAAQLTRKAAPFPNDAAAFRKPLRGVDSRD